ncbi:hypothetical protein D3C84_1299500 [compost metagenome]
MMTVMEPDTSDNFCSIRWPLTTMVSRALSSGFISVESILAGSLAAKAVPDSSMGQ